MSIAPVGYDYMTHQRGAFACLQNGLGRQVILTEYPQSLLKMHQLKLLDGQARADAIALTQDLEIPK